MTCTVPREPRRASLPGSSFVRAIAALSDAPAVPSDDAFAQRLGAWFDWTQAISLSGVLDDAPAHVASAGDPWTPQKAAVHEERARARVRAALTTLVEQSTSAPAMAGQADRFDDFPAYRQRYAASQQAMAAQIGALRQRVRATLAGGPAHLARLAALDAVMERVLAVRERALLATAAVVRLEARFEQLRTAHAAGSNGAAPWLATFRHEMQALLLAELDLRLQPVDGLIAACRAAPPGRPGE